MNAGISIEVNGAPDEDLLKASKIEVHEQLDGTTYYSLLYPEDVTEGDFSRLADERFSPAAVISISVNVDNETVCLVRGPVFSQSIQIRHGGHGSTVEVKGADSSITMDREFRSVVWPDTTDSDVVNSILANYSLLPDVDSTDTRHIETKHSLVQRETDLKLVQRLARRNGCYFRITAESPAGETAHFKRVQLDTTPVTELKINGQEPNIQSLSIQFDVERPTSVAGLQLDVNTKSDINGDLQQSTMQNLGEKSLRDITGDTRSVQLAPPADDAGDLQARGEAALAESGWFIKASCSASIHKVKTVIRPADIVVIDGAGSRHSGKYLVAAVRHTITDDDHSMDLELVRNGWL